MPIAREQTPKKKKTHLDYDETREIKIQGKKLRRRDVLFYTFSRKGHREKDNDIHATEVETDKKEVSREKLDLTKTSLSSSDSSCDLELDDSKSHSWAPLFRESNHKKHEKRNLISDNAFINEVFNINHFSEHKIGLCNNLVKKSGTKAKETILCKENCPFIDEQESSSAYSMPGNSKLPGGDKYVRDLELQELLKRCPSKGTLEFIMENGLPKDCNIQAGMMKFWSWYN